MRLSITFCGLILLFGLTGLSQAQSYAPKGPIEQSYMANGPWAVTKITTSVACDREGKLCDIWYPTNLGATGLRHPVVAWANGSGQVPMVYQYWLRHLATWGFIVVGSRDDSSSSGGTVIDAANYIINQGNSTGSIFFGKVDGTKVGVAGHSQGGCTVAKLFSTRAAPFSVYYSIHPTPMFLAGLFCGLQKSQLANGRGAILYMNSVDDGGALDTQNNYYNASTNAAATKALGILAHASHSDVMGNPGCTYCITGVYGYLGYPTAWFMWKLQGATDGPAAFSSGSGEFKLATPDWTVNLTNVP